MLEALSIIIGYLLGSIPTAYLAGRVTRGVDIRKVGGGNMGALNAARELSPITGLIVLLIDVAKGAAAIVIARYLGVGQIWVFLTGFAAIAGHNLPVFLKFRGGKGAATAIGVFFALAPVAFACCLPIILAVIFLTSNVTLGMGAGFVFFPLFLWIFGQPFEVIIYAIAIAVLLGIRYIPTARRNLKRVGLRDSLIERNYKPWQTKRKGS